MSKVIDLQTKRGELVKVELCFMARKADDGEMYIPYENLDEGRSWIGDTKYSAKVQDYTRAVGCSFHLTDEVVKHAEVVKRNARLIQWRDAMTFLFSGLAFLWVFVTAAGWIVRGFAGIPRGKDARLVP